MDPDDELPRKAGGYGIGGDLSTLSVQELEALITALEAEIARIKEILKQKESTRVAADSFFKS